MCSLMGSEVYLGVKNTSGKPHLVAAVLTHLLLELPRVETRTDGPARQPQPPEGDPHDGSWVDTAELTKSGARVVSSPH